MYTWVQNDSVLIYFIVSSNLSISFKLSKFDQNKIVLKNYLMTNKEPKSFKFVLIVVLLYIHRIVKII